MSIYRIPFLLAAAGSVHKSLTLPSATVSKERLLGQEGILERLIMLDGSGITSRNLCKFFAWVSALAETGVILGQSGLLRIKWRDVLLSWLTGPLARSMGVARGLPLSLVLGGLFAIGATMFRISAHRTLGHNFTYQLTITKEHQLVTDYPYNIVRHPSYTGCIGTYVGAGLVLLTPDGWLRRVVLPAASHPRSLTGAAALGGLLIGTLTYSLGISFLFPRTNAEDSMLKEKFGIQWERWATRVPYKLIPMIW